MFRSSGSSWSYKICTSSFAFHDVCIHEFAIYVAERQTERLEQETRSPFQVDVQSNSCSFLLHTRHNNMRLGNAPIHFDLRCLIRVTHGTLDAGQLRLARDRIDPAHLTGPRAGQSAAGPLNTCWYSFRSQSHQEIPEIR